MIATFARSCLSQFGAIEPVAERGVVCGNLDRDQAPGGAGLIARSAEFHQQFLTRQLHRRQLLEPPPQPLQTGAAPYHAFAELIGLKGIFVDDPDKVGVAWEEALAADRPTVVEFKTDPEVPPLPPHITLKQAKAFATTLLAGDPEEGSVIMGTARQVLASILPGKSGK
jgi:pyruvate dehydrogenase (quinone)